jgi:hypothetical protein
MIWVADDSVGGDLDGRTSAKGADTSGSPHVIPLQSPQLVFAPYMINNNIAFT